MIILGIEERSISWLLCLCVVNNKIQKIKTSKNVLKVSLMLRGPGLLFVFEYYSTVAVIFTELNTNFSSNKR